jgi:hypothetical protein
MKKIAKLLFTIFMLLLVINFYQMIWDMLSMQLIPMCLSGMSVIGSLFGAWFASLEIDQ